MQRCWVNFQCRGVLLVWMIVGQGPIALAAGAGGSCLDIFTLIYPFFPLSPPLWETARYRLKYSLKGPLNPKQPTSQHTCFLFQEEFTLLGKTLLLLEHFFFGKKKKRENRYFQLTGNSRCLFFSFSVQNLSEWPRYDYDHLILS